MRDALGDRMKRSYEDRTRFSLPLRSYVVLRVDGRAFHAYCARLPKPFCPQLLDDMCDVARYLVTEISGAKLAYAQSDEVSVLLTDFDSIRTQAWFDNNLQKIVSVGASLATARLNYLRDVGRLATFDARAFTLPDPVEVANYLIWRQRDATRNAVSLAARAHLSHRTVQGRSSVELLALLRTRGVAFEDYDPRFRFGTLVTPTTVTEPIEYTDHRTGERHVVEEVERRVWITNHGTRWSVNSPELLEHVPRLREALGAS